MITSFVLITGCTAHKNARFPNEDFVWMLIGIDENSRNPQNSQSLNSLAKRIKSLQMRSTKGITTCIDYWEWNNVFVFLRVNECLQLCKVQITHCRRYLAGCVYVSVSLFNCGVWTEWQGIWLKEQEHFLFKYLLNIYFIFAYFRFFAFCFFFSIFHFNFLKYFAI